MGQNSTRYKCITNEEKGLISDTFNIIRFSYLKNCGTAIFVSLFSEYPKYAAYFESSPPGHGFEEHCDIIVDQLDAIIKCIDKPEALLKLLTTNATMHFPRNVTKQDFVATRRAILHALEHQLGQKFNQRVFYTWNKCLRLLFEYLYESMEDMKKNKRLKRKE